MIKSPQYAFSNPLTSSGSGLYIYKAALLKSMFSLIVRQNCSMYPGVARSINEKQLQFIEFMIWKESGHDSKSSGVTRE